MCLHVHLTSLIHNYGPWTYLILFVVVFCETGLVVTPFLPGDSLILASGTFAAAKAFKVGWLFLVLSAAAASQTSLFRWLIP